MNSWTFHICYKKIYGYQYTGMLNEPGKNNKRLGLEETEALYAQFYHYQRKLRGLE